MKRSGDTGTRMLAAPTESRDQTYEEWLAPLADAKTADDIDTLVRSLRPRPEFFPLATYEAWLKSPAAREGDWSHVVKGFLPGEKEAGEELMVLSGKFVAKHVRNDLLSG